MNKTGDKSFHEMNFCFITKLLSNGVKYRKNLFRVLKIVKETVEQKNSFTIFLTFECFENPSFFFIERINGSLTFIGGSLWR